MTRHSSVLIALVLAVAVAGCDFEFNFGEMTPGQQERIGFGYSEGGFGCMLGCTVDRPLMQGARVTVRMESEEALPKLVASTVDPSVVRVELHTSPVCCKRTAGQESVCESADYYYNCKEAGQTLEYKYSATVTGVARGKTDLQLHTTDGKLFDAVTLEVDSADRIAFFVDEQEVKQLSFASGDQKGTRVTARALDDDGEVMVGGGNLNICSGNTKVAAYHPTKAGNLDVPVACIADVRTGTDSIHGQGPGVTSLKSTAGGKSGSIKVTVK